VAESNDQGSGHLRFGSEAVRADRLDAESGIGVRHILADRDRKDSEQARAGPPCMAVGRHGPVGCNNHGKRAIAVRSGERTS
jgi:hypothetical protein